MSKIQSLFCRMIILTVAFPFVVLSPATAADFTKTTRPILRAASELDYPPFALVQEDGRADGFSVDLLKAVARAVGLDIRFDVGPWHEIKQQLVDGKIDVLPLVSYSAERDRIYDFTAPYLRMHGTIFVRKGENRIRSESDLKDKAVIVMRGDTAHEYALRRNLTGTLVLTDSFKDAMTMLSEGKHDAVIIQQLVGLRLVKKLGLSNLVNVVSIQETSLKPVDKPLGDFEQKFCVAVKDGNRELQGLLNEGLAIVIANGVYNELYDKWFGPILPQPPVPLRLILKHLFFILCPILFLTAILGIWYLKREVKRKTLNLREEIQQRKLVEKDLYEKEENLRITLNSIGDAVMATDTEGRIVHMNPEAIRLTGWHENEVRGEPMEVVFNIINEYTRETLESPVKKVLREGVTVGLSNHTLLISKNGQETPIADSGAPIKNKSGKITGVVLAFRDQTEERAAQKWLAESEKRYRQLFDNLDAGFALHEIILDDHGAPSDYRFLEANPAFEQITGKAAKDILGKTVCECFPETEPYLIKIYGEVATTGQARHFENYDKGTEKYYSVTAYSPRHGLFATIFHDVTEKAIADQEFRKLVEAVTQASEGIVVTDIDGQIIFANPAFENICGYKFTEIVGKTPRILKSGKQDASFYKNLWETILSGNRWSGRVINRRKDGTLYTAECSISPVNDHQAQMVGFVWMTRDISKDLEMENRLAHSQRIEAIGALAGGIAHDFNNILFPIMGLSEMLMEDLPPQNPNHENVKEIYKAAERARDLVKQILSFSRQSDLKKIPVRIQQILKEAIKLSRASIPVNIEIDSDIQGDCGMVMANPTQLHQIATNLITNAYHAVVDAGGSISIRLSETECSRDDMASGMVEPGKYATLVVSDTGTGIEPSVMARIFEPYFTTKGQGKGTGLGLSMVYGIVKEHGGDIRVDSDAGKGARFTVYLPLIKEDAEAAIPDVAAAYETGTETILLVDDEAEIVRLEKQMLERLGYRITNRTSSVDALAAFRANPEAFDLVITDMTMPNMTGDQLAKKLISIRPDVPIIICTGFSENISKEEAKVMGIKGFLMKPVVKAEMAGMIRKVLNEAKISTQY